MAVIIDKKLCVGCGTCESVCPHGALSIEKGIAVCNDDCIGCGMCVSACPVSAISAPAEEKEGGLEEYRDIFVFCQQSQGELLPVSLELVGKARKLADACGQKAVAVVFGWEVWGLDSLIHAGADSVIYAESKNLSTALELPYAGLMTELIEKRKPSAVLFGATPFGRTFAPMVAARLKTGLTADCTVLEMDEKGLLKQTRPAFGGNLMATIVCENSRPQMATVRPGIFAAPAPDMTRKGRIELIFDPVLDPAGLSILSFTGEKQGKKLSDYDVLVTAGRGIGRKKNLEVVKELASLLGGEFAVSRPLIDEGWADYSHQVGQTGATVAPKLLISLGVSGAIQHLAGISGAEKIIAVNTDPDAPIFGIADYAVHCDCIEFAEAMIEEIKKGR